MADKLFKKNNGVYYTPAPLAKYLASQVIDKPDGKIFDPAYGEGSLLLAAEEILAGKKGGRKRGAQLFGCDLKPVNGLLQHIPSSNLSENNFFEYTCTEKFDVILMNPPYVRHHNLENKSIEKNQDSISSICRLNKRADLWAYFIVKSLALLKPGSSIGAILPWSVLQADYSKDVRKLLADNFEEIKILALGAEYFEEAEERVVLLLMKRYGKTAKSIEISYAKHFTDSFSYWPIDNVQWLSNNVLLSSNYDVKEILSEYFKLGYRPFENYATTRIGVVTGANRYFIKNAADIKKFGFSEKDLVPIFTTSRDFTGLYLNGTNPHKKLISLNTDNCETYKAYIHEGIEEGVHETAHSQRRKPWYSVDIGKIPDAFFTYRASEVPYLIMNDHGVQCTNSIHRIYFKNLTQIEKKWLQISILSVAGQLSLEASSKVYGGGVLKIEPGSLKKALVYKNDCNSIEAIYERTSKLISEKKKNEAVKLATNFINEKLGIPNNLTSLAESALHEIKSRRLNR